MLCPLFGYLHSFIVSGKVLCLETNLLLTKELWFGCVAGDGTTAKL